jgi:hypothetical protein
MVVFKCVITDDRCRCGPEVESGVVDAVGEELFCFCFVVGLRVQRRKKVGDDIDHLGARSASVAFSVLCLLQGGMYGMVI